jgi:hypothetical protein
VQAMVKGSAAGARVKHDELPGEGEHTLCPTRALMRVRWMVNNWRRAFNDKAMLLCPCGPGWGCGRGLEKTATTLQVHHALPLRKHHT